MIVRTALGSVKAPGRLEIVGRSPIVILDGAHNIAGITALSKTLAGDFTVDGLTVAVVGLLNGRDPVAMTRKLAEAGVGLVVACTAPSPRGMPAKAILAACAEVGIRAEEARSVRSACDLAIERAGQTGLVVVTGSLYVVGEARTALVPVTPPSAGEHPAVWAGVDRIPELDGWVPRH
jgi:dihydrofolate synthase/folylpolyglutamate synthase